MCNIVAAADQDSQYIDDFLRIVKSWVAKKPVNELNSRTIIVSAGPWRSYDFKHAFNRETKTMRLDFYSNTRRTGFHQSDVIDMINLL